MIAASLVAVLTLATIAFGRLREAPPAIDAGNVVLGTVTRGDIAREILGHGVLVPEEIHWVVAIAPGRVKRVAARVGAVVRADDVLVELDNADLEIAAVDAERQLASAEADLASLRVSLTGQRLALEASLAQLRGEVAQAARRDAANEALSAGGLVSQLDRDDAREKSASLGRRVAVEERRLAVIARGERDLPAAASRQVDRFRAMAAVRREQLAALRVAAGADGTVVEMPIESGQWVVPGAVIAKIARPGRLKAEIRVAETLAQEIAIGQPVRVDTHTAVALGRVAHVDPAVRGGTIRVDVAFDRGAPEGARPDQSVDGVVEIEHVDGVLRLPRPALAQPGRVARLFKLDPRTGEALRTTVDLGRASIDAVEIKAGLAEGDRVILSDTTAFEAASRLRIR